MLMMHQSVEFLVYPAEEVKGIWMQIDQYRCSCIYITAGWDSWRLLEVTISVACSCPGKPSSSFSRQEHHNRMTSYYHYYFDMHFTFQDRLKIQFNCLFQFITTKKIKSQCFICISRIQQNSFITQFIPSSHQMRFSNLPAWNW